MALFILLLSGPSAMGRLVLPVSLRLGGWIATVAMVLAAVGLNVSWIVSRVPEGLARRRLLVQLISPSLKLRSLLK